MANKRGLSHDDKRLRLREIFAEKMDFFQLREVEIIAKREKGLNPLQVKDLIQSLVADALLENDKIGTSTYYWFFSSNASTRIKNTFDLIQNEETILLQKKRQISDGIANFKQDLDDSDAKQVLLDEIEENSCTISALTSELGGLLDSDAVSWEKKGVEMELANISANRWTDNIFSIVSWCKSKFGIDEQKLTGEFNIPEDLDYLDNN